jgi:hypothetical protein
VALAIPIRIALQPDIAVIETALADPATFAKIPLGTLHIQNLAGRCEPVIELKIP